MKIKSLIATLVVVSVALTSCSELDQGHATTRTRAASRKPVEFKSTTYETNGGVQIGGGAFLPGAKIVGSLDGPQGTVHMKPGYQIGWETVLEYDEFGMIHAVDHMYLTRDGERVTE